MKQFAAVAILALAFAACTKKSTAATDTKDGSDLHAQVKAMDKRLKKIERLLANALNRPAEPDASATYAVPISREDPIIGAKHAEITIVKGFEYACPFCESVRPALKQLMADYPGKIRIVYKYFVVHEVAIPAGLAACAANKQGKFSEVTELIWSKGFKTGDIGAERLTELAKEAGLDMEAFKNDMKGPPCINWVKQSQKTLTHFGTTGTPAFYVNGRFISGAQPVENFKRVIDQELAKVKQATSQGVSVRSYYDTMVIGKGLKEISDDES